MTDEKKEKIDVENLLPLEEDTSRIMKSEFRTGLLLTIIYFAFIFLIPILNWYKQDWAFSKMWGGMSNSWFLTAIVSMAMAFCIAYIHTKLYEKRLEKYDLMKINKVANQGDRGHFKG